VTYSLSDIHKQRVDKLCKWKNISNCKPRYRRKNMWCSRRWQGQF